DIDLRAMTMSQQDFVRFLLLVDSGITADRSAGAVIADAARPETDRGTGDTDGASSDEPHPKPGADVTTAASGTPRSGHVDFYHGTEVPDPYCYLEDPDDHRTREFVATQNTAVERYFTETEFERVRARIEELNGRPRCAQVKSAGGWYFFTANPDSLAHP
ncbi:hypothetical protein D3I60_01500, partial [Brevibacterium permense]|nr:hypothetical protein [Brevibacterium permense]